MASDRNSIQADAAGGRRIRLVFLIRTLEIGGAERQLVTLAKRLDQRLFEVTVLCLYDRGEFARDLTGSGVRVIFLNKKRRWEVFGFLWRLTRQLRQLEPDILHPYLTAQNLMAVLIKPALPSARIVWGVRASNMNTGPQTRLERRLARLAARLSPLANLIIFNSRAGQDHSKSLGYSCESSLIIPNGVDLSYFSPDSRRRAYTRASWGLTDRSPLIGLVARLDPMKDHPTFLRAAAIFLKSRPCASFVCVGGGPEQYARELGVLAEELGLAGKVVWAGSVADMPDAYNALDICCSSSAYGEGTPNCILEAMACGVPCVVTDVGDSRLVVGDAGIVVPPRDPEALAAAWNSMTDRLGSEPSPGMFARWLVERRFGVDSLVRRTSAALQSIV